MALFFRCFQKVSPVIGTLPKFEVHAFLKEHDVPFYTLADLEHDRETSDRLGL